MRKTIHLPERFTLKSMSRFQKDTQEIPADEFVEVAFGPYRDFPPSAMLLVYASLQCLIKRLGLEKVQLIQHEFHTYAGHMGLFRLLGYDLGRDSGMPPTTLNYIPLQRIRTDDWIQDIKFHGLSQHVDEKCRDLSNVLSRGIAGSEVELLHFNIRELMRNVFEHSEATEVIITAQYWPKLKRASVGLLDNGIGLLRTVSRNNIIPIENDLQAIESALLPGITGSNRLRSGDDWDNTGYGLYMTSEIARNNGKFNVASGTSALELIGSSVGNTDFNIEGTFLSMDFTLDNGLNVDSYLTAVSERGAVEARTRFGSHTRPPSKSSKGS